MTPNHIINERTTRRTVTAGVSLVALTGTAAAHAGGSTGGGMMGGWGVLGGAMGVFGLLWMGLLVALPVLLAYRLLGRSEAGRRDQGRDGERTLASLRERYARGELSDEEFDRRRNRLDRTG